MASSSSLTTGTTNLSNYSWFLPSFSLIVSSFSFIPSFIQQDEDHITSETFVIHSSLVVLCCGLQLLLHPFTHQTLLKLNYFQIPQKLLLCSITFPALILYTTSLVQKLSPSMFLSASFSLSPLLSMSLCLCLSPSLSRFLSLQLSTSARPLLKKSCSLVPFFSFFSSPTLLSNPRFSPLSFIWVILLASSSSPSHHCIIQSSSHGLAVSWRLVAVSDSLLSLLGLFV
jgi:hypothetical protein